MRDILFGYDVQSIGQKPYKSLVEYAFRAGERATTALTVDAWALGLRVNRRARAYGLPLIASHVGADTAACLVATGLADGGPEPALLVDMGIQYGGRGGGGRAHRRRLLPRRPGFRGAASSISGCRAADGAIESLAADGDGFACRTIGGGPAEGLCGSGLIDLLAELRRHGRMTAKGGVRG